MNNICSFPFLFLSLQELKIKSSHDVLTQDPRLSSQPAVDDEELERRYVAPPLGYVTTPPQHADHHVHQREGLAESISRLRDSDCKKQSP